MSRPWRMVALAVLIMVLVVALTPYLWLIMTSLKTRLDALADNPVWLFTPTFEHYPKIFIDKGYLPLVMNSLVVATASTAISLAVGVPAAYVFTTSPARRTCSSSSSPRAWHRRSRWSCRCS